MDQIRNDIPTWIDLNNKVSRLTLHGESYEERIHALENRLNSIYETLVKHDELIKALSHKTARQSVRKLEAKKKYTEKQVKKAIIKTLKEYSAPVNYDEFIRYTFKHLKK